MTQRQIFDADARAIAYLDEGEGPAVVLIPGHGQDAGAFATLTHILADEGFRVVGVEGRKDPVGLPEQAQDILDLMDHIGLADAWIGGHGASGAIARTVALGHADRTNGLLLLGATTDGDDVPLAAGLPVLIVHGTADEVTPLAHAEQLQASAPDRATLVRIDGGGHLFPTTHPGEAAFAIAEYLDWD